MKRITLWGPAPNRHLEPLIRALDAEGMLAGVYYAGDSLGWKQLGTAPSRSGATFLTTRQERLQAFKAAITDGDGAHLMVSFANRLCFEAMARCARAGKPYFVLAESFTPRGRSPRGVIRDVVYRYLLRRVAAVFALAPACALDFRRVGVPAARIYPGIYPGPDHLDGYRPVDASRIVFCGRLVPIKGIDVLATALRKLALEGRSLKLDVVGEGPTASDLEVLKGTSIRLTVHGAVESARVKEILRGAGALVLPTRFWEGWGYVVNEALAAGVPVVVSDVVAARELIVEGRSGAVFKSEDSDSLAAAIGRALALHADPGDVASAIEATQHGMTAEAFAKYMIAAMNCAIAGVRWRATPPWHAISGRLGGNPEVRWWKAFHGSEVVDAGNANG